MMKKLMFKIAYKLKLKKLAFKISPSIYIVHEYCTVKNNG